MFESSFLENIQEANKINSRKKLLPVPDRFSDMSQEEITKLGNFTVLNQSISLEGLRNFFNICGFPVPSDDHLEEWVLGGVERGLLQIETDNNSIFFLPKEDVHAYFEKELPEEIKTEYRLAGDRFYISWLTDISTELQIDLPQDEEARRIFFIGPNGLLDILAHSPQFHETFIRVLNVAVNWQELLFQLKKFEESADIVNMICFALARQGDRSLAESLLIRIISMTHGLTNLIARINLATLLREEAQLRTSLQLYRGTIIGLLRQKAFHQLVIVFSEIGAIYRLNGQLLPAAITLEMSSLLHGILKNNKSQAIARSQLASVYRYTRLYGLALRASKLACSYFRTSNDYLNLGRSLLTRGNVLYNLNSAESSLECFEEALSIGRMISDPQSICGALGGKARVLMLMNNLTEVKPLLDEVISIRQRNSDHSVGIEYQNMGYFYELSNNLPMALVWYNKAVKSFQQYMPVEVAACERAIRKVEGLMKNSNRIRK